MLKKNWIEERADLLLFDYVCLDSAIIGISRDNRVVYDYDLMVDELACALSQKDGYTQDHDNYRERAIKILEESILKEYEYEDDGPIVIERFEE